MGCGVSSAPPVEAAPPAEAEADAEAKQKRQSPSDRAKAARAARQMSEVEVLCDELLRISTLIEPKLTDSMRDIAEKEEGRLEGLDYRLKGRASLVRKATSDFLEERTLFLESLSGKYNKQQKTMEEIVFLISDAIRYTIIFSTERYTLATKSCLKRLQSEGYLALKVKNYWDPGDSYQGINSVFGYAWTNPETNKERVCRVEIQFHTPESFEVKMASHKIYEQYRTETDEHRKVELYEQMLQAASSPTLPPDVLSIDLLTSKPPPELYKLYAMQLREAAAKEERKITATVEHAVGKGTLKDQQKALKHVKDFSRALRGATRMVREKGKTGRREQVQTASQHIDESLSYNAVFSHNSYWKMVNDTIRDIEAQGDRQVDYENYWVDNTTKGQPPMYKGYHMLFQTPTGIRYEVQFHTPETYDTKDNKMDERFDECRKLTGRDRTLYNLELIKQWKDVQRPRGEPPKARDEWKLLKATVGKGGKKKKKDKTQTLINSASKDTSSTSSPDLAKTRPTTKQQVGKQPSEALVTDLEH
eukprot:TRINITY_DN1308_c1_g1_i4.p1 TRINITY_DN1308_c1_g1~~TRINITY_DN1308_c1_g1_i4.p1  ORF type:complete len:533 (-),score=186.15 TRINITY_DN1308_c1_g1_i4:353-1951(-)